METASAGRSSSKSHTTACKTLRARAGSGLARVGRTSAFLRGCFWPAGGSLTSLSSRTPRIQRFAHQLFDHFTPGRLGFWLRGDKRIQPRQQFWRHSHPYRRARLCSSCLCGCAHYALQFGWSEGHPIEDLGLDEKSRIASFERNRYRKRPIMKYHCHFKRLEPERGCIEFRPGRTMPPPRRSRESQFWGAPHRSG
jgi:hypothetical protein